jgi:hypothetical protein
MKNMIQKNYDDGKKHIHVLSYGGGTQSTALLLMALKGEINGVIPDYIIFSDTGWEPKAVYEWVDKVNKYIQEKFGRCIIFTNNGNIREDIIAGATKGERHASIPFFTRDRTGWGEKGKARRQCTDEYKIKPVNRKIKELLGYKPRQQVKEVVHIWKGISTDEIRRVKPILVKNSQGEMVPCKWRKAEHPLVDVVGVDRSECIKWVEDLGLGTPPQSSCIGCPFHNDSLWLDMKKNDPEAWDDAVEIDKTIRNHPKFKQHLFLHRSCKPLNEVEFHEQSELIDFFDEECEGMCGL